MIGAPWRGAPAGVEASGMLSRGAGGESEFARPSESGVSSFGRRGVRAAADGTLSESRYERDWC